MKFKDVKQNKLYLGTLIFDGRYKADAILYIWNVQFNPTKKIEYELFAADFSEPFYFIIDNPNLKEVPVNNLLLYVNFKYKSINFDCLLKGLPIARRDTLTWELRERFTQLFFSKIDKNELH